MSNDSYVARMRAQFRELKPGIIPHGPQHYGPEVFNDSRDACLRMAERVGADLGDEVGAQFWVGVAQLLHETGLFAEFCKQEMPCGHPAYYCSPPAPRWSRKDMLSSFGCCVICHEKEEPHDLARSDVG